MIDDKKKIKSPEKTRESMNKTLLILGSLVNVLDVMFRKRERERDSEAFGF